jgi:hypothetical protein
MSKRTHIDARGVMTALVATALTALIGTVLVMWRDSAVQQEQLRQLEQRVNGLENHGAREEPRGLGRVNGSAAPARAVASCLFEPSDSCALVANQSS